MAYPYYGGFSPAPQYGGVYQPQMPAMNTNFFAQQQAAAAAMQAQPPKTNKIFVTSLEAAKAIPADYNSYMIYLDQDKPLLYEVYTDGEGKKNTTIYTIAPQTAAEPKRQARRDYATKEELAGVERQLKALTERFEVFAKAGEKIIDDESIE